MFRKNSSTNSKVAEKSSEAAAPVIDKPKRLVKVNTCTKLVEQKEVSYVVELTDMEAFAIIHAARPCNVYGDTMFVGDLANLAQALTDASK